VLKKQTNKQTNPKLQNYLSLVFALHFSLLTAFLFYFSTSLNALLKWVLRNLSGVKQHKQG